MCQDVQRTISVYFFLLCESRGDSELVYFQQNNTPIVQSRVVRSVKLAFRYGDSSGEKIRGEVILKKGRGACERSIDFGFKMHFNACY